MRLNLYKITEALKHIKEYLLPVKKIAGKFKSLTSLDELKIFIQERSAHVTQTTLYGYIKTRMGFKHYIMFEDKDKPFRNGLRFKSTDVMDDRWYNWRVHNWGTKWDCYDLSTDDCDLPNGFEASFNTAWSPPEEICYAIREKFDGISVSWFYDEPGCEVAGYL